MAPVSLGRYGAGIGAPGGLVWRELLVLATTAYAHNAGGSVRIHSWVWCPFDSRPCAILVKTPVCGLDNGRPLTAHYAEMPVSAYSVRVSAPLQSLLTPQQFILQQPRVSYAVRVCVAPP
jgi:hypothetical protein